MSENSIEQLVSLIFSTKRFIQEKAASSGDRPDILSWLRIETLRYIEEHEGITMRQLAEYLNITAPSVTSLVNKMQKAGLARRVQDKKDRRITILEVTAKGKRVVAEGCGAMMLKMQRVLSKLEDGEVKDLTRILIRIRDVYQK